MRKNKDFKNVYVFINILKVRFGVFEYGEC